MQGSGRGQREVTGVKESISEGSRWRRKEGKKGPGSESRPANTRAVARAVVGSRDCAIPTACSQFAATHVAAGIARVRSLGTGPCFWPSIYRHLSACDLTWLGAGQHSFAMNTLLYFSVHATVKHYLLSSFPFLPGYIAPKCTRSPSHHHIIYMTSLEHYPYIAISHDPVLVSNSIAQSIPTLQIVQMIALHPTDHLTLPMMITLNPKPTATLTPP